MSKRSVAAQGNKSPFRMLAGISSLDDLVDGVQAMGSLLWGAKTVYFVDGNYGNDGKTGTGGWDNAMKTMTVALAASHADIASGAEGWAAKNVILCKGDTFTEDLDLIAQKTVCVGVGSHDRYQCGVVGNHTPITNSPHSSQFIGFHFMGDSSGGDIWTLSTVNAGLQFHNNFFDSSSTTAATAAIVGIADSLKITGNTFMGAFSDAVIEISAGMARGLLIKDNFIEGANQGIHINSSVTDESGGNQRSILIQGNTIRTAGECIYDSSDIAMIIGNMCVTAQAEGTTGAGGIVGEENLSMDNKLSCSDGANFDWPAVEVVD